MTEPPYDRNTFYAVLPRQEWRSNFGFTPQRGLWLEHHRTWLVEFGTFTDMSAKTEWPDAEVMVLGLWEDKVHPLAGAAYAGKTWAQMAELKVAEGQERITLEGRLAAAGIRIDVPRGKQPRAIVLNHEELDRLLGLAGF